MKVQIDKRYALPCSAEIAWEFLQDIEAVAACMPGAKITERIDAQHYKGTVTTKLGPATMSFRGEVEISEIDATARSLRMVGKGTDTTGGSGASMSLGARVEAADTAHSELVGNSEISMSGRAAAFGGRMMSAVGDQILQQFADNFAGQVGAIQAQRAASPPPRESGSAPTAPAPADHAGAPAAAPARELKLLALAWQILKTRLHGLFSKKTA
jgi:carbon monoxide dehydrogenase subunit G